jgi:hypothetical protein
VSMRECVRGGRQSNRALLNKCGACAAITNVRSKKVRLAVATLGSERLFLGL